MGGNGAITAESVRGVEEAFSRSREHKPPGTILYNERHPFRVGFVIPVEEYLTLMPESDRTGYEREYEIYVERNWTDTESVEEWLKFREQTREIYAVKWVDSRRNVKYRIEFSDMDKNRVQTLEEVKQAIGGKIGGLEELERIVETEAK